MLPRSKYLVSLLSLAIIALFWPSASQGQGGRIDKTFFLRANPGADVTSMVAQTDGKILIAGRFSITNGSIVRRDIVRLNPDGSIDPTFDAGAGSGLGSVLAIAVQPDGKILAGGPFNSFNGVQRNCLVRLNANGSVDESLSISDINVTFVFDIDLQPDGKIYVSALNAIGTSFIARLTSSGANDTGFGQPFYSAAGNYDYRIHFIGSENKLLVGAAQSLGPNQGVLMKILPTGAVDSSFVLPLNMGPGSPHVNAMPISDGKVLVWGRFDSIAQIPRTNIAVINSDASVDTSFVPETASSGTILAVAVQADGKIIIGGRDFLPNGVLHGNLARLNAHGTADRTFNAGRGANRSIKSLQITGSKLLIGGDFFRYDRAPYSGLARVRL